MLRRMLRSRLANLSYCEKAKGYPDLSTRSFLRLLSMGSNGINPTPPICCLVDFDPDGIAIMSNYKYGSRVLSHENDALNVAAIQWLGVKCKDICRNMTAIDDEKENVLPLCKRDRKKAINMLQSNDMVSECGVEQSWRRELQVMLMLGVKAEMDVLSERDEGLNRWVEDRLLEEM